MSNEISSKTTVVKVTKDGNNPAKASVNADGKTGSATADDANTAVNEAAQNAKEVKED